MRTDDRGRRGVVSRKAESAVPSNRRQARLTNREAGLCVAVYAILAVVAIAAAEQAGDYLGAVIAGMIEAGEPEAAFERLEKGKVRIEVSVFHTV